MVRILVFVFIWTLQAPPDVIQKSSTGASARIQMVRKSPKSRYEGIVRLNGKSDDNLCVVDHTSEDGSHGYVVEHSEWTSDGRFFVWSLSNSGGHQPWHTPTMFFDGQSGNIRRLDDFVKGPGITSAEFKLVGVDEIEVAVSSAKSENTWPIRLSLVHIARTKRSKSWTCAGGVTIRP